MRLDLVENLRSEVDLAPLPGVRADRHVLDEAHLEAVLPCVAGQGDYLALKKFYGDWAEHGDPRVFQYAMMGSKAERDAMLGAEYVKDPVSGKRHWVGLPDETGKRAKLGEGDRIKLNAFASDLKYADEAGWLKLAVDRFKAQE